MKAGNIHSTRLTEMIATRPMEAPLVISPSRLQPRSLTAKGIPKDSTADHHSSHDSAPARNLRSVVERRFMRMNEAHDRIRTELLCSHTPETE